MAMNSGPMAVRTPMASFEADMIPALDRKSTPVARATISAAAAWGLE